MSRAPRNLPSDEPSPELDLPDGVPSPRVNSGPLLGQEAATAAFLTAWSTGRLHHAWLLTGQKGIGKATLAFQIARFLLSKPEPGANLDSLEKPTGTASTKLIAAQAHPDLVVLRREWNGDRNTFDSVIRKDRVDAALSLMQSTPAYGGWRIVIVDSVDDLNRASANALLKVVEEPPPMALFLLVHHGERPLLPTMRSRCRRLSLAPLSEETVTRLTAAFPAFADLPEDAHRRAAARAQGSVAQALSFLDPDAAALRDRIDALLVRLPVLDPAAVQDLAEGVNSKTPRHAFRLFVDMVQAHLTQSVHRLAGKVPATVLAARAELWEKLVKVAREAETFNLDRRPIVLSMLTELSMLAERESA